jgi:hypothetical protein
MQHIAQMEEAHAMVRHQQKCNKKRGNTEWWRPQYQPSPSPLIRSNPKLSLIVDAHFLLARQASVDRLFAPMHASSEHDSSSLFLQSTPAFEVKYVEVADKDRMFLEASFEFGFNATLIPRLDIGVPGPMVRRAQRAERLQPRRRQEIASILCRCRHLCNPYAARTTPISLPLWQFSFISLRRSRRTDLIAPKQASHQSSTIDRRDAQAAQLAGYERRARAPRSGGSVPMRQKDDANDDLESRPSPPIRAPVRFTIEEDIVCKGSVHHQRAPIIPPTG